MIKYLNKFIHLINDTNVVKNISEEKIWLSRRDIKSLSSVILWITRTEKTMGNYIFTLGDRMIKLWDTNGSNFTFLYFKYVVYSTVRFLSGNPIEKTPSSGTLVRIDSKTFLPTIFPIKLRADIQQWTFANNWREMVALLSFLCLFRSFPTKVKPKFDTITSAFSGVYTSFSARELSKALKDISFGDSRNQSLRKQVEGKYHFSDKAGPNVYNSKYSYGVDSVSLFLDRETFSSFMRLALKTRSYLILLNFIMILPLSYLWFILNDNPNKKSILSNGRLAVVYNQAGKARVVAMTNVWIQSLFSTLHRRLFHILKKIPSDATFNQKGITKAFIEREKGSTFFCYDLTAATDRLPLDLQIDILNRLGYDGTEWGKLIRSISWSYKRNNKEEKSDLLLKYAVGQPMGALSSWAMLALTHHVIVRIAALRNNKENFDRYLVLGDDIVICDPDVASTYLLLMKDLGVEINLSKSVISDRLAEFAKLWVGPGFDISPIGSGLLVQSLREKASRMSLIYECYFRNLISIEDLILKRLKNMPRIMRVDIFSAIWGLFLIDIRNNVVNPLEDSKLSIKDIINHSNILIKIMPDKIFQAQPDARYERYVHPHQFEDEIAMFSIETSMVRFFLKKFQRRVNRMPGLIWKSFLDFIDTLGINTSLRKEIGYGRVLEYFTILFNPYNYYVLLSLLKHIGYFIFDSYSISSYVIRGGVHGMRNANNHLKIDLSDDDKRYNMVLETVGLAYLISKAEEPDTLNSFEDKESRKAHGRLMTEINSMPASKKFRSYIFENYVNWHLKPKKIILKRDKGVKLTTSPSVKKSKICKRKFKKR